MDLPPYPRARGGFAGGRLVGEGGVRVGRGSFTLTGPDGSGATFHYPPAVVCRRRLRRFMRRPRLRRLLGGRRELDLRLDGRRFGWTVR